MGPFSLTNSLVKREREQISEQILRKNLFNHTDEIRGSIFKSPRSLELARGDLKK